MNNVTPSSYAHTILISFGICEDETPEMAIKLEPPEMAIKLEMPETASKLNNYETIKLSCYELLSWLMSLNKYTVYIMIIMRCNPSNILFIFYIIIIIRCSPSNMLFMLGLDMSHN